MIEHYFCIFSINPGLFHREENLEIKKERKRKKKNRGGKRKERGGGGGRGEGGGDEKMGREKKEFVLGDVGKKKNLLENFLQRLHSFLRSKSTQSSLS